MLNRWGVLIIGFVLCFVALEIYSNTSIMDQGYLVQELKLQRKVLIEDNGHLQQALASRLSLNKLDDIARERLALYRPQVVRYLDKDISPPHRSSSPPPSAFWQSWARNARAIIGGAIRRVWPHEDVQ
jgi:hypothetical protein